MSLSFFAALVRRWSPTTRRRSERDALAGALALETLEDRRLMAVDVKLKSGVLTISGDRHANTAIVDSVDGQTKVTITSAGETWSQAFDGVVSIKFTGGAGDDVFINNTNLNSNAKGGGGNDTLQGGSGIDLLYGNGGHDVLIGGLGDDRLYGNGGNDTLEGLGGDDWLDGGGGHDAYIFSGDDLGLDTIVDGGGTDALDFSFFAASLWLDLASTLEQSVGGEDLLLRLKSVRSIENVFGSAFDDVIFGNALNNRLVGNGGDDWISGGKGHDVLEGGEGNDTLSGDDGNDLLTGGAGYDQFYGGNGFDRFNDDFTLFLNGASIEDVNQGESGVCTILAAIASTIGTRDWTTYIRALGGSDF